MKEETVKPVGPQRHRGKNMIEFFELLMQKIVERTDLQIYSNVVEE